MKRSTWVVKAKKDLREIRRQKRIAKKDARNRALMVIEAICGGDILNKSKKKLEGEIYMIAHSAIKRGCEHKDWREKTEKMFIEFEKHGLI